MFCKNCGQEIIDGAAFCANCGERIAAEPQPEVNNTAAAQPQQEQYQYQNTPPYQNYQNYQYQQSYQPAPQPPKRRLGKDAVIALVIVGVFIAISYISSIAMAFSGVLFGALVDDEISSGGSYYSDYDDDFDISGFDDYDYDNFGFEIEGQE